MRRPAGPIAAGFAAIGEHVYTRAVQDREVLEAIAGFWRGSAGR